MTELDYKRQIEALLFASGRLMDIDTLVELTSASSRNVVKSNVSKLIKEYEERNSPMMVVEEKNGWKLTVREPFLPLVRKIISETELPKTVLETLAVIAWKAPVLQSDIIDIRHNKAYDHISLLENMEFIKKEAQGRSYLLKITEKFYNYFDVDGSRDIRDVFNRVVGTPEQLKIDDIEILKNRTDINADQGEEIDLGIKLLFEGTSEESIPNNTDASKTLIKESDVAKNTSIKEPAPLKNAEKPDIANLNTSK